MQLLRPMELNVKMNTPQYDLDYEEWANQQEENEGMGIKIDRESQPNVEDYIEYKPMLFYTNVERISYNIDDPKTSYFVTDGIIYIVNLTYEELKNKVNEYIPL